MRKVIGDMKKYLLNSIAKRIPLGSLVVDNSIKIKLLQNLQGYSVIITIYFLAFCQGVQLVHGIGIGSCNSRIPNLMSIHTV